MVTLKDALGRVPRDVMYVTCTHCERKIRRRTPEQQEQYLRNYRSARVLMMLCTHCALDNAPVQPLGNQQKEQQ